MRFFSLTSSVPVGIRPGDARAGLPPVARRIDELLYGPPPTEFARPPGGAPLMEEVAQVQVAGPISTTRFDDPSPAWPSVATSGFVSGAAPPTLAPQGAVALPSPPPASTLRRCSGVADR